MNTEQVPNSDILIYQQTDGNIKIDVQLEDETVWLTQAHLCELFNKFKATVSEHISHQIALDKSSRELESDIKQLNI